MARPRDPKRKSWPPNLGQNPSGYFYFVNPKSGKKHGLGRDKASAMAEARSANAMLAAQSPSSLVDAINGVKGMSFKEWLPIYEELWRGHKTLAASTIKNGVRHIRRFAELDFAWMPLADITVLHVSKFLDELGKESPGSAMNVRVRLNDVFAFAATKGHIPVGSNPVVATLAPNYKVTRDRLTLEQFLSMRNHPKASPWLVDAMDLALLTAQRVGDIAAMQFSDVYDGYLHVDQKKMQGDMRVKLDLAIRLEAAGMSIGDVVKRCRNRFVSSFLIHHLKSGAKNRVGENVEARSISQAFRALYRKIGFDLSSSGRTPPSFHEIRSLSERLYRDEQGKDFAQALLGHKNASTTDRYNDLRGSAWATVSIK